MSELRENGRSPARYALQQDQVPELRLRDDQGDVDPQDRSGRYRTASRRIRKLRTPSNRLQTAQDERVVVGSILKHDGPLPGAEA